MQQILLLWQLVCSEQQAAGHNQYHEKWFKAKVSHQHSYVKQSKDNWKHCFKLQITDTSQEVPATYIKQENERWHYTHEMKSNLLAHF